MTTNPSARLNADTEPDPLPIGYAASPRRPGTRFTSTYSVRPRSLLNRAGSSAATVAAASGLRPPRRRTQGATNSWNVKIAEVGNPGRIATGVGPTAPRQIGLPGFSATPWTTTPGALRARTRYDRSPAPLLVPPLSRTTSSERARSNAPSR